MYDEITKDASPDNQKNKEKLLMKKMISIALAAVMALSLAACGGNDGLSGKVATDGSTSSRSRHPHDR